MFLKTSPLLTNPEAFAFVVDSIANKYNIPITMIKGISDDTNNSSEAELFKNLLLWIKPLCGLNK